MGISIGNKTPSIKKGFECCTEGRARTDTSRRKLDFESSATFLLTTLNYNYLIFCSISCLPFVNKSRIFKSKFSPAFFLTGHSRTQEPDFKYPKWETFFGKPLNGCAHLVLIPIPLNRIIINEELLCLSKSLILIQRTSQVHEEYCG